MTPFNHFESMKNKLAFMVYFGILLSFVVLGNLDKGSKLITRNERDYFGKGLQIIFLEKNVKQ
jgi:hypothetical protein